MAGKLDALAARLRKNMEAAEEARRRTEEERRASEERSRKAREEAQRARAELLDELEAFGRALGHLDVKREGDVLTLGYGAQALVFQPEGDEDRLALATGDGEPHYLARDDDGEWLVVLDEGRHLRRLPLEAGLEELLVTALKVPGASGVIESEAPSEAAEPERAEASSAPEPSGGAAGPDRPAVVPPPKRPLPGAASDASPGSALKELKLPWE